jgi:hypothetical protein
MPSGGEGVAFPVTAPGLPEVLGQWNAFKKTVEDTGEAHKTSTHHEIEALSKLGVQTRLLTGAIRESGRGAAEAFALISAGAQEGAAGMGELVAGVVHGFSHGGPAGIAIEVFAVGLKVVGDLFKEQGKAAQEAAKEAAERWKKEREFVTEYEKKLGEVMLAERVLAIMRRDNVDKATAESRAKRETAQGRLDEANEELQQIQRAKKLAQDELNDLKARPDPRMGLRGTAQRNAELQEQKAQLDHLNALERDKLTERNHLQLEADNERRKDAAEEATRRLEDAQKENKRLDEEDKHHRQEVFFRQLDAINKLEEGNQKEATATDKKLASMEREVAIRKEVVALQEQGVVRSLAEAMATLHVDQQIAFMTDEKAEALRRQRNAQVDLDKAKLQSEETDEKTKKEDEERKRLTEQLTGGMNVYGKAILGAADALEKAKDGTLRVKKGMEATAVAAVAGGLAIEEAWRLATDAIGNAIEQLTMFSSAQQELAALSHKTAAEQQAEEAARTQAYLSEIAKRDAVLALEELAKGIATSLVPGLQAESATHFAAAAVLGAIAGGTAAGARAIGASRGNTQQENEQLAAARSSGAGVSGGAGTGAGSSSYSSNGSGGSSDRPYVVYVNIGPGLYATGTDVQRAMAAAIAEAERHR